MCQKIYILFKNLSVVYLLIKVFMFNASECSSMSIFRSSNITLWVIWIFREMFSDNRHFSCCSLSTKLSLICVALLYKESLGFAGSFTIIPWWHRMKSVQLSWSQLPGAFFPVWLCLVVHEEYPMWNQQVRCEDVILDTFWKLGWNTVLVCFVLLSQNT